MGEKVGFKHGHAARVDPATSAQTFRAKPDTSHSDDDNDLHALQMRFVKPRRHVIAHGDNIPALLEGRDSRPSEWPRNPWRAEP